MKTLAAKLSAVQALQATHLDGLASLDEASAIMKQYDADASRKLDLKEFRKLVSELRAFQEKRGAQ